MKVVHIAFGVLAIGLTAGAAALGAWLWWRVRAASSTWFWRLLRAGQVAVALDAALGGVLVLSGRKPPGLHYLYGLVPLAVSFVAEQLRIATAEMVLDARGHESAQDVGRLPADEQHEVVRAILQRELGVMTLSAVVNVVLLARAAGTG
jgi:hypothetical protein